MVQAMDSSQAKFMIGNLYTQLSRANSEATFFAASLKDAKRELDMLANYFGQLEKELAESERRRKAHKCAAVSFKRETVRLAKQLERLKNHGST